MTITNRDAAKACDTPIFTWLLVFAAISCARIVKNVILLFVNQSSRNPDKVENKVDILYCCTILNFEVIWLIYGNTFHYSEAGLACMNESDATRGMWILMTILLIYGYLIFILYTAIFIGTMYMVFVAF